MTEHQNVDATHIDMIIGSLAGALCGGGGFCVGTEEVVEHQRLSASAYTYSAALPAMLATTASETVRMLQEQPDLLAALRENTRVMWTQLDPRSDWVRCSSAPENPILLLVLKEEVVTSRKLSVEDQEWLMQDVVDEVSHLVRGPYPCARQYAGSGPYTDVMMSAVSCKQRAGHETEEHAGAVGCSATRSGMAASACAESMCHDWSVEEGNGEGRSGDQACYHQDHD